MKTFKFNNRFGPGFITVEARSEMEAREKLVSHLVANGYPASCHLEYYEEQAVSKDVNPGILIPAPATS